MNETVKAPELTPEQRIRVDAFGIHPESDAPPMTKYRLTVVIDVNSWWQRWKGGTSSGGAPVSDYLASQGRTGAFRTYKCPNGKGWHITHA